MTLSKWHILILVTLVVINVGIFAFKKLKEKREAAEKRAAKDAEKADRKTAAETRRSQGSDSGPIDSAGAVAMGFNPALEEP